MTQSERLKEQLESFDEDYRSEQGICVHVSPETQNLFEELYMRWPERSGHPSYPVPHPSFSAQKGYYISDPEEMWNPKYAYAAARWRLIRFCLEELSK